MVPEPDTRIKYLKLSILPNICLPGEAVTTTSCGTHGSNNPRFDVYDGTHGKIYVGFEYGDNVTVVSSPTINETANSINTGTYTIVSGYTPFTIPSQPSPSNSIADVNQYETFSTTFTGGSVSSYTYNWIISNAVTGNPVYSSTYTISSTTNSLTLQLPQYFTTNSPLRAMWSITDGTTTLKQHL